MPKRLQKIVRSFPVQLLFIHLRRNPLMVAVWGLLVALFMGGIGKIYGVHFLFLDPEYLGSVGFWSFFIVGAGFGCFTMAFHITSYILDSHRFPFVGVLERPFAKYSLNNSLLPFLALITYLIFIIRFQLSNEFSSPLQLFINLVALLTGIATMLASFYFYFKFTNKDIFKYLTGSVDKRLMRAGISRETVLRRYKESRKSKYEVHTYFDLKLRPRSAKWINEFHDKEALLKVFDQNHLNSVIFELGMIALFVFMGTFMEYPGFQIPAAASCLLLMSVLFMLIGAVSYWLKDWSLVFVVGMIVLVNSLIRVGVLKGIYEVRGLDYHGTKAEYNLQRISEIAGKDELKEDSLATIESLNNWKQKQTTDKPKIVFLCVSGGGQRAALWTVNSLQRADEQIGGTLMDRTFMISGASGGMIGAAYYRDVNYAENNHNRQQQIDNMGKDNLNSVIYSLLVNDVFFRVRKTEFDGKMHTKDRGYVFEETLNQNLGGLFRSKLIDYKEDELSGNMPVMIFSPVIANDGRKLHITNLPSSYLNTSLAYADDTNADYKVWGVNFGRLFQDQGSAELSFLSALRMSASFPYITPTISLPSEPRIEIMDAGIADNFGVSDAVRFIHVFQDWIEVNTSGAVLMVVRDSRKIAPIEPQSSPSLGQRITYPIASVYNNLANIQDNNNDQKIEQLGRILDVSLDVVEIEYNTYTNIDEHYLIASKEVERKKLERASLSWHLTTREKQNIISNIELPSNQQALKKFTSLFAN